MQILALQIQDLLQIRLQAYLDKSVGTNTCTDYPIEIKY